MRGRRIVSDDTAIVSHKYIFEKYGTSSGSEPDILIRVDFNTLPQAVFSTLRDWEFTAVAVDDEKFDDEGALIHV